MNIVHKVKPIQMVGNTKEELLYAIRMRFNAFYSSSNHHSGLASYRNARDQVFYGVNLVKMRRKRGKRNNHWIAYIYKFNDDLVRALNLRIVNKSRNFVIEKIK